MSVILNIDTAQENAFVAIAKDGLCIASKTNLHQKEHASFLHPTIQQLLELTGLKMSDIDAFAVTKGPGSYTGIRVGLSSAKGFCYATQKPLITLNSLEVLACEMRKQITNQQALICPMIDARRMEVFTAVYACDLSEVLNPCAMVLDTQSFQTILEKNTVYFSGSGAEKYKSLAKTNNAQFIETPDWVESMCQLAHIKFVQNKFDDLVNSDPLYVKEHQTLQ
jgi:tRNA threonylcarbamoyladenosine biosynthesis protein TsaB